MKRPRPRRPWVRSRFEPLEREEPGLARCCTKCGAVIVRLPGSTDNLPEIACPRCDYKPRQRKPFTRKVKFLNAQEPLTSERRASGFGPYDADPKGHEFDPKTRACRRCFLVVGTAGVTGLVPCFGYSEKRGMNEQRASDAPACEHDYSCRWCGEEPTDSTPPSPSRRELMERIEGALRWGRRGIAWKLLAECYRELGGRNRVK